MPLTQLVVDYLQAEGFEVLDFIALEIVEYAKSSDIDLVIMGTHGRGLLQHLLMGSVAERVVRWGPCPVLTVRSDERDFVQPDALTPLPPG